MEGQAGARPLGPSPISRRRHGGSVWSSPRWTFPDQQEPTWRVSLELAPLDLPRSAGANGGGLPSAHAPDLARIGGAIVHSLPRLTLPQFTGEPGQWPKWFAIFKILVDDQVLLSSTEKMVHLQAEVSVIAQHTISGLLCDGRFYEDALKALKDRFGREEDVIHASLKEVFSLPAPMKLDPVSLERFHRFSPLSGNNISESRLQWRFGECGKPPPSS